MSSVTRLLVALLSTTLVGYLALGTVLGRVSGDSTYTQLAVFNEVLRTVVEFYVEPISLDRTMAGARRGLTDALDGDSAWLDEEEYRAYRQSTVDDADVGLMLTRRYAFLAVVATRAGAPAAEAGLRPGDLIKTIDDRHTRPLSPVAGQRLLRGEPGSVVKLTILRAGTDPMDVSLVRARSLPPEPTADVLKDGIASLRVPEAGAKMAEQVRVQLDALRRRGANKLVLDLRGAGWGQPADGLRLAELFLHGGVVARVAGKTFTEETLKADAKRQAWTEPLIVLVDFGTAGPAEVVAAALAEAGRAQLVGSHTFGRAPLQRALPVEDGALLLTVARYSTPKGEPIHGKGLEPTVAVDAPRTEDADPALDKAIELLSAKPEAKAAA